MPLPQKFRPYFSPSELQEIIRCMKTAPTTSIPLLRYLESFSLKITHGTIQPQYTAMPSIDDRLGLPSNHVIEPSPQELYIAWTLDPTKITPTQMSLVNQYRYENSLMDPSEESAYVDSLLSSS